MKKIFSILLMLAVVVACAFLPFTEADAATGEDIVLDLSAGTCGYSESRSLPHVPVTDEGYPAFCNEEGLTDGTHCSVCGEVLVPQKVIPALGHDIQWHEAKIPTYSSVGWEAYEDCTRCAYSTYEEIPALETPPVETYEDFVTNLALLEELAYVYIQENPGKDPADLVIKYIRTGVDRYNSGSWGIMAGYEDAGFAKFVAEMEDMINSQVSDVSEMICITSMKDIKNFYLPNGDYVDLGHLFGTMDITYHNNYGVNHADVAGWAGDLVDLLSTADRHAVSGTMDQMIADIAENYLNKSLGESDIFGLTDMYGDLDGFYVMQTLQKNDYETGMLTAIITEYFTEDLTDEDRAEFFLQNRLGGVSTRGDVRTAVYNAYTGNKVIATLEGTREFTSDNLDELKMACCFAFADYICKLAGDYVEVVDNPYYSVFSSNSSTLAPGITQKIEMATSADGKQMVYYLATADLRRDDVQIYANYNNNDPAAGWAMQRVLDQANATQNKYGDPNSQYYIPNYNVIASINGAGFNMSTGEPSGLLIMNGVVYQDINSSGFVGILKDGTAVIGTKEEYLTIYKDQVAEGIAGFGATLVKDGKITVAKTDNYTSDRASRTAIGITRTGKVVFMVLDGRQEPWSCGGSMQEIAQIMLEAGCVHAINLDGGGSTTFVAKQEGATELSVVNKPSDGVARSVSTSLFMVSTAPSSTAFDHAILNTPTDYITVGSSMQITPSGVSATGNTAELPEGTTWAVSRTRWASITEDGVLTALRNGDVEVYLMLGDEIIGSKTIHIVVPSHLYFAKPNINAVYGQSIELPIKALYEGKEVTIRPDDIVFSMSNTNAGVMDGFSFIGNEKAGIKMVVVTAVLASDESISANLTLNIYKQGENSFDFDQATGGDREFAWDRVVSNATTDDAIKYIIVDKDKDMVTSYVFAIDMTQIPIPQQLEDLIYMLPGSDMEGASAWNFLLQLAERVSVLSEVKPVIRFDPNFDVDYSELKIVTDYFVLTATEFDEATNSLTMTLNWIDQTRPIDPSMANPLCLLSGIKLTPKADAQWDEKGQLPVVNVGEISYKICLRASSLYSFAQKPDNQATYGLYPYANPNDSSDKGGCFSDVYHAFEDTYTLVKALKNGWMNEEGGFAYYKDGEKYFGIRKADGLYYNFGETGINVGKTPYSGLLEEDGLTYYAKNGEPITGWQAIGDDWYLFDRNTGIAVDGTYQTIMDGITVTYEMDNGRLVKGFWYNDGVGLKYYYGPYCYHKGWKEIDGERYFFENYHAHTGVHPVQESHSVIQWWYVFADDGKLIGEAADGLYWFKGELYYVVDTVAVSNGLTLIDGDYYHFNTNGTAVRSKSIWVTKTNGLVEVGTYRFAEDGKLLKGEQLINENGTYYYYLNGMRALNAGLIEYHGDYYYIDGYGKALVDRTVWVTKTNGLKPVGSYFFDAEGKMVVLNGVIDGYYYVNGAKVAAGLVKFNGHYYYAASGGQIFVNRSAWITKTNDLVEQGTYRFDAEGKMLLETGVFEEDGKLYYYKDGKRSNGGLIEYKGDYYYFVSGDTALLNKTAWVSRTNGLVEVGTYRFDETGKMIRTTEVVNEGGTYYYYRDGIRALNAGMIQFNGEYYYIDGYGAAIVNRTLWATKTNGLKPVGSYSFDAEGKMIRHNGVYEGYYYIDGIKTAAGLVEFNGHYYYAEGGGRIFMNRSAWISNPNGLFEKGTYRFDAEGKMLLETGVFEENGKLYYYKDGKRSNGGLIEYQGNYYYFISGDTALLNKTAWVSRTNGLVKEGMYRFDETGKMLFTTGVVEEDGKLYYYENGMRANGGLVEYNGDYYYFISDYTALLSKTAWVSRTNGLVEVGTYRFDETGKMIRTTEVVNEGGIYYYYCDGIRALNAGLIQFNGELYYIDGEGKAIVNRTLWITKPNGLKPIGSYSFDAEGKMIRHNGIVDGYYYIDGVKTAAGLVEFNGHYYYAEGGGRIFMNRSAWITNPNGLVQQGTYRFDAEGRMLFETGVFEEDGKLYYYENGKRTNGGLVEYKGDYYYFISGDTALLNDTVWVSRTNGLVQVGTYRFGADGKMIRTTEVVYEEGAYYYYRDGIRALGAGLIEFDGAYYYIDGSGKAITGREAWVSKTNGFNVAVGMYLFAEDGKMVL